MPSRVSRPLETSDPWRLSAQKHPDRLQAHRSVAWIRELGYRYDNAVPKERKEAADPGGDDL